MSAGRELAGDMAPLDGVQPARGQEPLAEGNVTALWNAAKEHTDDLAEQAWLVTMCLNAGHGPDWLAYRAAVRRGRGESLTHTQDKRLPHTPAGC